MPSVAARPHRLLAFARWSVGLILLVATTIVGRRLVLNQPGAYGDLGWIVAGFVTWLDLMTKRLD